MRTPPINSTVPPSTRLPTTKTPQHQPVNYTLFNDYAWDPMEDLKQAGLLPKNPLQGKVSYKQPQPKK